MRPVLLATLVILAGCAAERPSLYDYSRPFPQRSVDGVLVFGPYSAADVEAIVHLVNARTEEPIQRIGTPSGIVNQYYRGEIMLDAIPADTALVKTGQPSPFRGGHGMFYSLSKRSGIWAVRDSSEWIG